MIKDDHNQIAIDVLHDTYDTENPYPLVLGIQYEGSKSLFNPLLIFLDFIFTRVIKFKTTNYISKSLLRVGNKITFIYNFSVNQAEDGRL